MTRDEELDAVYNEVTANDTCIEDSVTSLLEEIVRLRKDRDAMESMYRHHVAVALDAIAKLNHAQAILAALREPSEAVIRAAQQKWDGDYCRMGDAIIAALAAAEKEVQGE